MSKHWTQTPEGRERMRKIALASNNVAKAREAKANGDMELKELKVQKEKEKFQVQRVTALSVYGWEILLTDSEIKIRKQS